MAIRVAAMLATSHGSPSPPSASARASQKVSVFPGFTTCARKTSGIIVWASTALSIFLFRVGESELNPRPAQLANRSRLVIPSLARPGLNGPPRKLPSAWVLGKTPSIAEVFDYGSADEPHVGYW